MKKQSFIYLISILIIFILNSFQCNKDDCYDTTKKRFEIPIQITTAKKDTILLGDSIIVNIEINDTLIDLNTQKSYYMGEFDFKIETIFSKVDSAKSNTSNSHFSINTTKGSIKSVTSQILGLVFEKGYNKRIFKMSIKPLKKGIYYFNFTNLVSNINYVKLTNLATCFTDIDPFYITNRQGNFYLYDHSLRGYINTKEGFERSGTFAFVVD